MNVSSVERKLIYINRFSIIDYFCIRSDEVLNIFHSRSTYAKAPSPDISEMAF